MCDSDRDASKSSECVSYVECVSRSLLTGLATCGTLTSSTYFGQVILRRYMPYKKELFMPLSLALGISLGIAVLIKKARKCEGPILPASVATYEPLSEKNLILRPKHC